MNKIHNNKRTNRKKQFKIIKKIENSHILFATIANTMTVGNILINTVKK